MAVAVTAAAAVAAAVAFGRQHSTYGYPCNRGCNDGSWWRRPRARGSNNHGGWARPSHNHVGWASASNHHGRSCDSGRGDHDGRVGAWRWRRSNHEARRTAHWLEASATDLGRLIPEVSLAAVEGECGESVVGADFNTLVQVTVWDLLCGGYEISDTMGKGGAMDVGTVEGAGRRRRWGSRTVPHW